MEIKVGSLWVDRDPFMDLDPEVVRVTFSGENLVSFDIKVGPDWMGVSWNLSRTDFLKNYKPIENGIERAKRAINDKKS